MKRNKSKRQKTISRKQRRLPKAIQRAPENVVRLVQPEQPPRRKGKLHISDTILARARALQPKPEQWPRPHGHPGHAFFVKGYSPFPPNAAPPDAGMAMDADSNQQIIASASWAAGALAGGYSEGLWFLGYPLLSEMMQRPEYRRMVERIAMEMTRKWIKLQSSAAEDVGKKNERVERIAKMEDEMKRLHVRDCFREIAEQDGAFGRSHLYLDTGDTDDREELMTPLGDGSNKISQSKVSRDRPLLRIKTIEPVWVYPTNYNSNDPMRTDWYNPTMWFVQGKQVHASRLLRFVGREVPDLLKPAYSFGGLPLIQMAKPYVDNWIRTRQAVADLVWSFSVSGLKTDLGSDLQEQGDDLFKRVDFFNSIRNNRGTMVLDKEAEDFFNITTPLSSLDVLQAQAQEHMAAVCGIPLVILLGISPHGLNASSEGEIRAFYDWVHAYQEAFFSDNLKRVLDFIQLSLFGNIDPSITFRYEPLWSLDDKAEAEKRKIEADTDVALIGGGVLDPLESRQRLASDPDSPFASIDVQDVPEPPQQDSEGGGGELGDEDGAPAPDDDDGGQAADAEVGKSAVIPFALDAEWHEADHPRGQPDNAGQFGAGGGGGTGAPKPSPKPEDKNAPLDVSKLKKIGAQMGSNPGGVYENDAGKKYYVKKGKSAAHVRNELMAAALYREARAPTLEYKPVEGGDHVATRMRKLDKNNAHKFSPQEVKEARKDFATHAWLANWDAVGTGGDNLGTIHGKPTALDLGGALEYRAQGAPKGGAFGNKVSEIDTMRSSKMSPDAARIFGGMTENEMIQSARRVTDISDNRIRDVIKRNGGSMSLADTLIARKNDIAKRVAQLEGANEPEKASSSVEFTPGEAPSIKELNGVAFKPWTPPEDWSGVSGQAQIEEPAFDVPEHLSPSSGVLMREPDGRVWLLKPKGGYGGYDYTFPKGGVERDLSPQANAIKEMFEETGLKTKITGYAGDYAGDTTFTRYYYGERETGSPMDAGPESGGVSLVPPDRLDAYLNRGRDKKIASEHLAQDAMAADDFNESDHPRVGGGENAGQFAPKGGGGGAGEKPKYFYQQFTESSDPEHHAAQSKKALAVSAQAHGNYRKVIAQLLKEGQKFKAPEGTMKALRQKIVDSWNKVGAALVKKGELKDAHKIGMKIVGEYGGETPDWFGATQEGANIPKPKPETPKPAPATPSKQEPSAEAKAVAEKVAKEISEASKYKPTPQDLEKAKKNVKLQLQYVPGAPQTPEAQKIVDKFNEIYEGKALTSEAELTKKVQAFKMMQAAMIPLMSAEQKKQAEAQAEAQKKAQEAAAVQVEAQKKALAEAKAKSEAAAKEAQKKNAEVMKELGVTEQEAQGFLALVGMMGGSTSDVMVNFKNYEEKAKSYGYPITGFQCALIRNYTNGGYTGINNALRQGSWTEAQHVYVKMMNKALKSMPTYKGVAQRGAGLSKEAQGLYKPGHIVEERAFTSSSVSKPWGGNTQFTITAIGKHGAHVKKLSSHASEDEVVFGARTFFKVTKVEGSPGGQMHVHMEEMEE